MRATPGMTPSACASSWAMAPGALRSVRASFKATGTARSPRARDGGTSTANGGTSATPSRVRIASLTASWICR